VTKWFELKKDEYSSGRTHVRCEDVRPSVMYLLALEIGSEGSSACPIILQGYIPIGGEGTRLDGSQILSAFDLQNRSVPRH